MTATGTKEGVITQQVAEFMRLQFPNAPYHIDFGAGAVLSKFQAIRQKRLNDNGWPDVFIAVPRGKYHGAFIELKREGVAFYKRDGKPQAAFVEQHAMHERLRAQGYKVFVCNGFGQAEVAIRSYLTMLEPDYQNPEPDPIHFTG